MHEKANAPTDNWGIWWRQDFHHRFTVARYALRSWGRSLCISAFRRGGLNTAICIGQHRGLIVLPLHQANPYEGVMH